MEAGLDDGDVARFALSGGGGALESGATVRRVRVDVPRETPL